MLKCQTDRGADRDGSAQTRVALIGFLAAVLSALITGAGPAYAQILLANDDSYGLPYGEMLVVDPFGVLDNDTLDG